MASRRLTKQQQADVPALYQPPAIDIDARDLIMPRLYIGQGLSSAVTEGDAKIGDLYIANGKDDPEPNIVWRNGEDGGVLFSVLGLKRGKSIQIDGELETWDYNDPNAHPDARVTYDYWIAVHDPEGLDDMPVKLLLKGTSTQTARQINLILAKTQGQQPPYALGFRLTTVRARNSQGQPYAKARAIREDLTDDQIATAATLAEMVASAPAQETTATEAPAI